MYQTSFFDTHCHLNFQAFRNDEGNIIKKAKEHGVDYFLIPGTDIESSQQAVALSHMHENTYAAVGIHPHHVARYLQAPELLHQDCCDLETLTQNTKTVAIGEIGLDLHTYKRSKYGSDISIDATIFSLQKELFTRQLYSAKKYNKSIVFHCREASRDFLQILEKFHIENPHVLSQKAVFHCCEPEKALLHFACQNSIFIGVDGDVTYDRVKQEFIAQVPLDLLVLETDSPYILPEPLKSEKKYPNTPASISYIAAMIAQIHSISLEEVRERTTRNGLRLFNLPM